jgi:hypothetical protein
MQFETAIDQWDAGARRVMRRAIEPRERVILDHVTERLVSELRRRLGGPFTTSELTELYEAGTSWCLDIAIAAAPSHPFAWEADVADAAFARYVREASDYAGGRRLEVNRDA